MQCCVPFCKSTAEAVSEPTGITFHEFPSEVHLRAAWLRALGKQDNLPDSAVVCSQHFLNDDISETKSGLRQIRTGAIPSTVQVCMICLDTRGKLYLMSNYKLDEAYQHLVGHPLCDQGNLKQTLCVQCAQRLVNFNKFRDKSLRARSLMMELVEQHESITMQHTDIFNDMNNQLKHNIVQTVLKPDHCDLYVNYTDEQTDKTVVKSEASQVSHESMSVGEDVTEHNVVASNENTEKGLNINLVVTKEEYVSDEEMKETADPLLVMPSTSKDEDDIPLSQIKYEITFECSVCSEEFADEDSYNYHMNVHMEENQNLAEHNAETGQPSVDPWGLATDLYEVSTTIGPVVIQKKVSNETVSETEVCEPDNVLTDSYVEYENTKILPDKTDSNDTQILSCKFCAYKTLRKDYLQTHILTHSYTCTICGKEFSQKSLFNRHMKTHTGEKPFSCKLCEYKSTFKKGLVEHMLVHTGEKPFSCEFCVVKFKRKSDFTRHTKIHTGEKLYSCNLCEYKSTFRKNLVKHMLVHTGEKPFSCEFCVLKFKRKSELTRHTKIHTGEKCFSCEQCDYKCIRSDDLTKHMLTHIEKNIHSSLKRFSCDVCGYKFLRKNDLVNHMKTHTGEKPFACNYCEYKCPRKKTLIDHIRTHTGEKPHCCKLCGYKCINKNYLMRHMKTHAGKQPFSCEYCGCKFAWNKNLVAHMKMIHKVKNYTAPTTSK